MGRCGRSQIRNNRNDCYSIVFYLDDHAYLIQCIYKLKAKVNKDDNQIKNSIDISIENHISKDEERKFRISNLSILCSIIILQYSY